MIQPPLLQAFANIHTALLADLKNLETILCNHPQLTNQQLERLNNWFDFYWVKLESHHKGEESYFFPTIGGYDAAFLSGISNLTQEHHELDHIYSELKDNYALLLTELTAPARENRYRRHVQLISALYKTLAEHLEHEEAIMYPAIIKNIPEKNQQKIDNAYIKKLPMKELVTLAPWLMANMTPEQRDWLYKTSPWILKMLYNFSWKKKYETIVAGFQV